MFYVNDDFTDAWQPAPTVLFVHGLAESTEAWRAWVPHFARRFRVVRLDLRGFGRSTPMPDTFEWDIDVLVDDIVALIRHLDVDRVHLVGAKSGGSMTLELAADHPALVQTLTGVTPPVVGPADARELIPKHGMREWARVTMQGRLGSGVSQPEMDWWVDNIQSKTPVSTIMGLPALVPGLDIRADVEKIIVPAVRSSGRVDRIPELHQALKADRRFPQRSRNPTAVVRRAGWKSSGGDRYIPIKCEETSALTVCFRTVERMKLCGFVVDRAGEMNRIWNADIFERRFALTDGSLSANSRH